MKQVQYNNFSLGFFQKGWRENRPNYCQFELTFACPLRCQYCYSSCYNNPKDIKNELTTKQVLYILDKVYNAGAFWLCFSGGEPIGRRDFLEIYSYAKQKGFLITVLTSGVPITKKISDYLSKFPPFKVEITLNSVNEDTYEKISGKDGSFQKAMRAISFIKARNIPLKINTVVNTQNYHELTAINKFVKGLGAGVQFRPNSLIFARLNHELAPCSLRLSLEIAFKVNKSIKFGLIKERKGLDGGYTPENAYNKPNFNLFRCHAGIDTISIDPYGNMFFCSKIRQPCINLLEREIADGFMLFKQIRAKKFRSNSKCKTCSIWYFCASCPGIAKLETKEEEAPVEYFCRLARLVANYYGYSD